jgi:cathepsin B
MVIMMVVLMVSFLTTPTVSSRISDQDTQKQLDLDLDLVTYINQLNVGWTAARRTVPSQDLHIVQKLLGVKDSGLRLAQLSRAERGIPEGLTPPAQFDSRENWPNCIGRVLNQGECGSCWAFGCSETLSDRFCIASNGSVVVQLSALDITTCDTGSDGCNGGDPAQAWQFAQVTGIVTEACAVYNESIPTCEPSQQPCLNFVPTPRCPAPKCDNGATWDSDKYFAKTAYGVSSKIEEIQVEMVTNGPVQASFSVYEDFLNYKSGVYRHITGKYMGGHSVKMIGYGTLNGTDYWLVQNSWTNTWGDDGYFMILRGKDECGIESGLVAGEPKLN